MDSMGTRTADRSLSGRFTAKRTNEHSMFQDGNPWEKDGISKRVEGIHLESCEFKPKDQGRLAHWNSGIQTRLLKKLGAEKALSGWGLKEEIFMERARMCMEMATKRVQDHTHPYREELRYNQSRWGQNHPHKRKKNFMLSWDHFETVLSIHYR